MNHAANLFTYSISENKFTSWFVFVNSSVVFDTKIEKAIALPRN